MCGGLTRGVVRRDRAREASPALSRCKPSPIISRRAVPSMGKSPWVVCAAICTDDLLRQRHQALGPQTAQQSQDHLRASVPEPRQDLREEQEEQGDHLPDRVAQEWDALCHERRQQVSRIHLAALTSAHIFCPRITAYNQTDLTIPLPITYTQPNKAAPSFYHKMCISPCERYIASGSGHGAVYAWEVGQNGRMPMTANGETGETVVEATEIGWNGHSKEVGAIDWAQDQVSWFASLTRQL